MAQVETRKGVRTPEAARRLGISIGEVYDRLFAGELAGGPGKDGAVLIDVASLPPATAPESGQPAA